jgi:predicted O-methyltransferase YrrM
MFALPLAFSAAVPALNAQRGARTSAQSANPPSIPNSEAEKRILAVLDQVRRAGAVFFAVDEDSGRMLRLLAETTGAKDIAEIGTSTGCSSLWMSMALLKSGGRLTTFEMDAERAATARKHFAQAGVERTVTVVEGDAHENIKKLTGPLDLVFIDADKEGYVDYLNRLLPLVRPGGLILADNVSMAPDYVKAVTTSAALETLSFLRMTLTLKKS